MGLKMKIIKKEKIEERFIRFDLSIEDTHNFVCEGIVVHNTSSHISLNKDLSTGIKEKPTLLVGFAFDIKTPHHPLRCI